MTSIKGAFMERDFDFDLFTIGGGSGGVRASGFAAKFGARVGIAEAQYLGGTCVNAGCIPKKIMSYAAAFQHKFDDAQGYGWHGKKMAFDWEQLMQAKDREIARLRDNYRNLLANAGVTIFDAHAVIEGPNTLRINGKKITARHILIATGGKPLLPTLPGIEHAISSDDFFKLTALPKRAVVVGGSYIAVELASILNSLGSQVTVVHRSEQILRGMDHELGEALMVEMRKKGVVFQLNTQVKAITQSKQIKQVRLSDGTSLEAECVLFATGRAPNTEGLGLAEVGINTKDNGAIIVDEQFQTNIPSIKAIGDVIDRVTLTPVALEEGMVVAKRLFNYKQESMSYDIIPTAVFTHPSVATVGFSESAAKDKFEEIRVFKSAFTSLKNTISANDERTFMKVIVDVATDKVLGMHMVGLDAGEIIQGFAAALQCGITKQQLDATLGIHPTLAEEFVTMRQPV
jgi:glutathione reductase (NADPH)